jgi:hypothetical protein
VEQLSLISAVPGDGKPLSSFGFSLGRRLVADYTGLVLNQSLDGFGFNLSYPIASVSASVGTSFLPNKTSMPLLLSRADAADLNNPAVLMGSPRVVGLVEIVFPSVLRQRVTVSLAMQEDLRGLLARPGTAPLFTNRAGLIAEGTTTQDPSRGGLVDTQYMGLGLRGNITGGLFYNTFFTLNTGRTLSYVTPPDSSQGSYTYTPILAALGGVGLNLYAEQALGSVAGLRFVLTTGDSWSERSGFVEASQTATPTLFVPITQSSLSQALAPLLGNIAFVEASYSMRPFTSSGNQMLENLQFGLTALVFLRPAAGPISVAVPDTAATSAYLGSELDFSAAFRPFSDLGLEAAGGLFFPNSGPNGAFSGEQARWTAAVTLSLSL